MPERQWAIWGAVAGAVVGLFLTAAAAYAFDEDVGAGLLLFAIVAGLPALVGLGAVLALDAGALLGVPGQRSPHIPAEWAFAPRTRRVTKKSLRE